MVCKFVPGGVMLALSMPTQRPQLASVASDVVQPMPGRATIWRHVYPIFASPPLGSSMCAGALLGDDVALVLALLLVLSPPPPATGGGGGASLSKPAAVPASQLPPGCRYSNASEITRPASRASAALTFSPPTQATRSTHPGAPSPRTRRSAQYSDSQGSGVTTCKSEPWP